MIVLNFNKMTLRPFFLIMTILQRVCDKLSTPSLTSLNMNDYAKL